MKKIFNKKVFSFILLVTVLSLTMSAVCFAAGEDVRNYITQLTGTIRSIAVVFIALAACTTAIFFMLGAVNPKWKEKAKDMLYALIIGVIVLVFANDIAGWIGDITGRENVVNNATQQQQNNQQAPY